MLKLFLFFLLIGYAMSAYVMKRNNPCGSDVIDNFTWNPRGCSWFFFCGNVSDPIENKCPDNLHYNRVTGECTYANWLSSPCTLDLDNSKAITYDCDFSSNGRLLPHPDSCSKYTVCWNETWQDFECPLGEHYSVFDHKCVPQFYAECDRDRDFCESKDSREFISNQRSCSGYFLCTQCGNNYDLIPLTCPSGYEFNKEIGICDRQEDVECEIPPQADLSHLPQPFSSSDCPIIQDYVQNIPHPSDCQFYYQCVSGRSKLQECRQFVEGYKVIFDIESNSCIPDVPGIFYPVCIKDANQSLISTSQFPLRIPNIIPKIVK